MFIRKLEREEAERLAGKDKDNRSFLAKYVRFLCLFCFFQFPSRYFLISLLCICTAVAFKVSSSSSPLVHFCLGLFAHSISRSLASFLIHSHLSPCCTLSLSSSLLLCWYDTSKDNNSAQFW